MEDITFVKGVKIDQKKLRKFLKKVNWDDYQITEGPDKGRWKSPITGDVFDHLSQVHGQLGAYLRAPSSKDPFEPTRAGYVRAIRRGLEPTEAQKEAHKQYARDHRRKKRANLVGDPGRLPQSDEENTEQVKVPALSWD